MSNAACQACPGCTIRNLRRLEPLNSFLGMKPFKSPLLQPICPEHTEWPASHALHQVTDCGTTAAAEQTSSWARSRVFSSQGSWILEDSVCLQNVFRTLFEVRRFRNVLPKQPPVRTRGRTVGWPGEAISGLEEAALLRGFASTQRKDDDRTFA